MAQKNTHAIQYVVDLKNCRAHLIDITMIINNARPQQHVSMPAWTPGSYMIRDFAQHIVSISATEHGKLIALSKINKNTFLLQNTSSVVSINYQVYAFDPSVRAAYIDNTMATLNGTALFLRPHDREDASFSVTIKRPLAFQEDIEVATNLLACDIDQHGFGTYEALTYESLVDHPIQIGAMKKLSFDVDGIPHRMVLVGDVRPYDEKRLVKDLTQLCKAEKALFAHEVPFSSYLFITRLEEGGHGGLEHRNSTMLLTSPYSLPKPGLKEADAHYRNFLGLCAHEYFHAWNVKNLKPRNFVHYDFDQECYTPLLWVFEGITSYYDDLLLKRSHLISSSAYLDILGKNYTKLLKTKGRLVQSLADSSFDAWIKFYRQNENSHNTMVSYYLKGAFIALMLDLTIRLGSNQELSLDDVMRNALLKYGGDKGLVEDDFFALLQEVGIEVESFKRDYIYGTKELDLAGLLNDFGVSMTLLADEGCSEDRTKLQVWLGAKIKFDDSGRPSIHQIENAGPAMAAGLCPHDEIIAINKIRLDSHNLADLLSGLMPKDDVRIIYARKKSIRETVLIPEEPPLRISRWSLKPDLSETEHKRLTSWLY